jgi:hypothetical protein
LTAATESNSAPDNLTTLETQLRDLSHDDQALRLIQEFADRLGKTKHRQKIFGAEGAIVRKPIDYRDVLARGAIGTDEDPFTLLQGDIVSTDAAYFLGERITDTKFAAVRILKGIASSTCDLIPSRRQYAALLRLQPIRADDPNAKQLLSELLKFSSTKRMYLPPLPNDPHEVIGNAVVFDGILQIRLEDLLMSTRHASLSLVGWRIFGSLVRSILVRAGAGEAEMRVSA